MRTVALLLMLGLVGCLEPSSDSDSCHPWTATCKLPSGTMDLGALANADQFAVENHWLVLADALERYVAVNLQTNETHVIADAQDKVGRPAIQESVAYFVSDALHGMDCSSAVSAWSLEDREWSSTWPLSDCSMQIEAVHDDWILLQDRPGLGVSSRYLLSLETGVLEGLEGPDGFDWAAMTGDFEGEALFLGWQSSSRNGNLSIEKLALDGMVHQQVGVVEVYGGGMMSVEGNRLAVATVEAGLSKIRVFNLQDMSSTELERDSSARNVLPLLQDDLLLYWEIEVLPADEFHYSLIGLRVGAEPFVLWQEQKYSGPATFDSNDRYVFLPVYAEPLGGLQLIGLSIPNVRGRE